MTVGSRQWNYGGAGGLQWDIFGGVLSLLFLREAGLSEGFPHDQLFAALGVGCSPSTWPGPSQASAPPARPSPVFTAGNPETYFSQERSRSDQAC